MFINELDNTHNVRFTNIFVHRQTKISKEGIRVDRRDVTGSLNNKSSVDDSRFILKSFLLGVQRFLIAR